MKYVFYLQQPSITIMKCAICFNMLRKSSFKFRIAKIKRRNNVRYRKYKPPVTCT